MSPMSAAALPDSMTAIEIRHPGDPEVLVPVRLPLPYPGRGELLVRVAAAGVNRPDVMQRRGSYPPPPGASPLPGLEFAGEVVALGEGVERYRLGDAVCALVAGGGYAEYAVVHERNALPVPAPLSLVEAAALPETFFTVWANVFQRGRLQAGDTMLVHGGTSGIGSVATLLGTAFGARVISTVGSADKRAASLALGAEAAILYRDEDFVAETLRLTGGRGAEVIVDLLGGDYLPRNYQAAALDGRIVQIGIQQGKVRELDLMPLLAKRLTHTGSTLRARSVMEKAAIARELEQQVWPLLEQGRIKPQLDRCFPLAEAAQAHARMESSAHIGKIMLLTEAGAAR